MRIFYDDQNESSSGLMSASGAMKDPTNSGLMLRLWPSCLCLARAISLLGFFMVIRNFRLSRDTLVSRSSTVCLSWRFFSLRALSSASASPFFCFLFSRHLLEASLLRSRILRYLRAETSSSVRPEAESLW